MSSIDLENVEPNARRAGPFTLDIELSKPDEENSFATDHYEILRVGPQADEDTIERVYRTLADRFHPDNPITGDAETFLRLKEAYETLSNQDHRAKYNVLRQYSRRSAPFGLRGREFFDGVRGGQNRRLALLCLLYRQRTNTHDLPGLTVLDLEQLTGCTREEVTSALWYLCAKRWATLGEFTSYSITADGFDFVESKLEDRLEFRALATIRYYRHAGERPEDAEPHFGTDTLPLDIEPAITSEGSVSIADHYEILGLGPQADEEAIHRVYRTLASRFHPDNPGTGHAKTFLRIKEAWDTLSDRERRAQYDAVRQRSKYSERFRLRGREFFEGIRGEQLRRLAVLCLLYRQAAGEAQGLTVLDLEQLTGCTREELGCPLWYLREKKWVHFGEFTEYSITAAGFDVVEDKLDDRGTSRSRTWLVSGDTPGNEFEYPRVSATQTAGQSPRNVAATPRLLIANATVAPEDRNSHRILETEQTCIKAGERSEENVRPEEHVRPEENLEVAQGLIQLEEASGNREQGTRLEAGAESAAESGQSIPVMPQPLIASAATAPAIRNLQTAGISPTDIFQHLLRLQQAGELSGERLDVTPDPARSEEGSGTAKQVTRFEAGAEPVEQSQQNGAVTPQSLIENTINAPTAIEQLAVTQGPAQIEEAPGPAKQHTRIAEGEPADINQGRPLRSFVRRLLGFDPGTKPGASSHRIYQLTPQYPNENVEVAQAPIPVPAETLGNTSVSPRASVAETAGQSQRNVPIVETDEQPVVTPVPPQTEETPQTEEAPGLAEQGTRFEDGVELVIESQQNSNSQLAESPADIQAQAPRDEEPAVTQALAPIEEAPGIPEPAIGIEVVAELVIESQRNSNPEIAAMSPTDIKAERLSDEQPAPRSQANVKITPQSPGVSRMNDSTNAIAEQAGEVAVRAAKRVIFSMGGKGGVGKTSVMTGLAEWFDENRIAVTLLDLDTENKACGSLTHFFSGRVPKINIHTPAGLDAFIDHLAGDTPVILADMGAGAGQVTHGWFDMMYPDMAETGVVFTAIGVVTPDPASVESVLNWAAALQDRVDYVIVENHLTEHADFTYWREGDQAREFQQRFQPAIVKLDNRLADLENAARNYGITLGQVAGRTAGVPELQKASLVMRAQSYRRRMFAEFDKVKELLRP